MTLPAGIDDFLAQAGWADAAIEPLAGDASFRRYFRIRSKAQTAMLMDAPPPNEDPARFSTSRIGSPIMATGRRGFTRKTARAGSCCWRISARTACATGSMTIRRPNLKPIAPQSTRW